MPYPQGAPGGPGYPPAQQPHAPYAAPTQQFARLPGYESGESRLPAYLASAIAALGFLVYLASFGPQFSTGSEFFIRIDLAVAASVLAALIAGFGLLPKQTARPALVGVLAALSFLLVISVVIIAPSAVTIAWGMYLVIAFTAVQAIVGVGALLLDAGIIAAPEPRPRYEQPPYGQYPGAYYGPPHPGATRQPYGSGYPPAYGSGGFSDTDPSTGGFTPVSPSGQTGKSGQIQESGSPTPPTGFPAYDQQPSSKSPTTQEPAEQQSDRSSS